MYRDDQISESGGGPKGVKRHVEGHGKMLPVDKICHLIDEGSEFLELGQLAGLDSPYGHIPRASFLLGFYSGHLELWTNPNTISVVI